MVLRHGVRLQGRNGGVDGRVTGAAQIAAMSDENREGTKLTRRGAISLTAALLALLGRTDVSAETTAPAPPAVPAPRIELRYYRQHADGDATLLYAEPLTAPVADAFAGTAPGDIELRWYDGRGVLLGSVRLPVEMQQRLAKLRG